MARKKKHEEHENHERWLVSYADFITLLFAFFVVMYSVSAVNEGKFRVLSASLESAFRSNPKSMQPIQFGRASRPQLFKMQQVHKSPNIAVPVTKPIGPPLPPTPNRRQDGSVSEGGPKEGAGKAMNKIADKVQEAMAPLIENELVTVRRFRFWIEIEIKTDILFPSGSAELEPHALPVLKRIAGIMQEYPNPIHIEGYTDNIPINTVAYPSNWELSAARATSVVYLFSHEGVNPRRLAAVGYGEFKPVASNDTEEGRTKNRKVVLVVIADAATNRLRELAQSETPLSADEPAQAGIEQEQTGIVDAAGTKVDLPDDSYHVERSKQTAEPREVVADNPSTTPHSVPNSHVTEAKGIPEKLHQPIISLPAIPRLGG